MSGKDDALDALECLCADYKSACSILGKNHSLGFIPSVDVDTVEKMVKKYMVRNA